jgi:hypothetical protein
VSASDVDDSDEIGPPNARRLRDIVIVVIAVLIVATSLTLSVFLLGSPAPPPFDLSLSVSPATGSVVAGGSVSATVTAALSSGSTRDVFYSCDNLPFGDCSFTPDSCSPTCSTSLALRTSPSTPAGAHLVTVRAGNETFSRTATFTLTVTAAPPPPTFNFSLSANPSSGSVVAGGSVSTTVTATLVSGPTQGVQYGCSDLPTGTTCAFVPPACDPTCSASLTLRTSTNTPAGAYSVRITASNGSISRTAQYSLAVTGITTLTFQKGDGGAYSETDDAYIYSGMPNGTFGSDVLLYVDAVNCIPPENSTICRSLVKFPEFMGPNLGQVPAGATIVEATLALTVTQIGGSQFLHQVAEAWTEANVTWNSFATPGSPGSKGPTTSFNTTLGVVTVNITGIVQNWINGDANEGVFIWTTSFDGTDYESSESANPPRLAVTFRSGPGLLRHSALPPSAPPRADGGSASPSLSSLAVTLSTVEGPVGMAAGLLAGDAAISRTRLVTAPVRPPTQD